MSLKLAWKEIRKDLREAMLLTDLLRGQVGLIEPVVFVGR